MRPSPRSVLGIAFVLTLALASAASADNTWSSYHWARTTTTFRLQVVDSVTSDWDGQLEESLAKWSTPGELDVVATSFDDGKRTRRRCRSVNGQMRVCNDSYGFNGWLGLASINIDTSGHIVRGVAKMNDSYASYWAIPGEKNHVMCQEIGHVLGLGHASEDGSSQKTCMDYSTDILSQWPNAHDYALLAQVYGQTDSYDSYDIGSDSDGDSGGCNAPPGKGCNKNQAGEIPPMGFRVHQGPGFEIWVAPGKNNTTWIHHITLVPDE